MIALLPFQMSGYHTGLGAHVAIFFIAILGLNILTGYTGQISIGHGAFMAIGGYTTAVMSHYHHTNLILTLPIAFAIAFGFGVLVGIPALRFSGVYLALATFALAVSVPQFTLKFSSFLGGSNGLQTSTTKSNAWIYGVSWSCAAILYLVAWLVLRGRTGPRLPRHPRQRGRGGGLRRDAADLQDARVRHLRRVRGRRGLAVRDRDERLRPAERVRGLPLAGAPDRRRRRRPRLALGHPRGSRSSSPCCPTVSADVPLIGSAHGQDVVFGLIVIVIMLLLPTGFAGLLHRLRTLPGIRTAVEKEAGG